MAQAEALAGMVGDLLGEELDVVEVGLKRVVLLRPQGGRQEEDEQGAQGLTDHRSTS